MHTRFILLCLCAILPQTLLFAGDAPRVLENLPYKSGDGLSEYERERCKLDIYLPANGKPTATLVWAHGGGLTEGSKNGTVEVAKSFARAGIAVASVNYRLSPKVNFPAYVEDFAAAAAWVRQNIAEHGGNPERVFVGGHSAGGYLTLMVALDPRHLAKYGLKPEQFAGYVPFSGQTMTHYTVRAERNIAKHTVVADEAAPVHHVRKDTAPILILAAENDMAARAEENQFLAAALKATGNKNISYSLVSDRDHNSIAGLMKNDDDPVLRLVLEFFVKAGGKKAE